MADKTYYRLAADGTLVPVKLVDNLDGTWSEAASAGGAVALRADAVQGRMVGGLWTLASITVVESIVIPDTAIGVRIRPSSDVRYAISEDPVVLGGETLVVGNTAYANELDVRLLAAVTGRTLRLLGTVAGQTVNVGFF